MQLTSTSFIDGQRIPGEFAFCLPDPPITSASAATATRNWPGATRLRERVRSP